MPNQSDSLPTYERPPVVETVLGVQFDPIANFGNAQLGAFWKSLDPKEWVSVSDQPALPTQFEFFGDGVRWPPMMLTQALRTRLQIKNAAGNRLMQIQHGRLHFNWLGEGEAYPRYDAVRAGFADALEQFRQFIARENIGEFRPNQWEVTYINNIPKGTVWNNPGDWSFFRLLCGIPALPGIVQGESFSGELHYIIPEQRGRLHILWQHIRVVGQERPESIRLTFTARGPIADSGDATQAVLSGVDLGHETIVKSFCSLMSDGANAYWGLKNVVR